MTLKVFSVPWNNTSMFLVACFQKRRGSWFQRIPLPWVRVHWLVQCTLVCHWLTQCTLWYHWATQRILAGYTGIPLEKTTWNCPTLKCHWRIFTISAYTGTPLEKLSWNCPTLDCHWRDYCSLHWNTTGTSMPAWNDKMAGHQAARGQVSVNSALTWSLLLCNAYQFCCLNVLVLQHHSVHALDMTIVIVFCI